MKNFSVYSIMMICVTCMILLEGCVVDSGNNREEISDSITGQTEDSLEDIHMGSVSGAHNGHDYVDLGLPSGLLWATCNVGANKPEEYGGYYAWGEIKEKDCYNSRTYRWSCPDNKYDKKTSLDLEDDAAHVNWGGKWYIPGGWEINELFDNCTWIMTSCNGVRGYNVKGPNGNSIFFPAAGWKKNAELYNLGETFYWSRESTSSSRCGFAFEMDCAVDIGERGWAGYSVRPVFSGPDNGGSTIPSGNEGSTTSSTYVQMVSGSHNGHDYVDFGLSSGVLWATCNVGARSHEEDGNYYAWGETTTKSDYLLETYKYANGDNYKLTKYCTDSDYGNNGFTDDKTVLDLTDDVARANWGGKWRMPTKEEIEELCACDWVWKAPCENGHIVAGFEVSARGNSIFLPAAGYQHAATENAGRGGYYWSSTLYSDDPGGAYYLYFDFKSNIFSVQGGRFMGALVRPVCDK